MDKLCTWCSSCGPNVAIDEDGCCLNCGASATGDGAILAHALLDALIWCSGSPDFNEGGQAREGWLKGCAPLLAPHATVSEKVRAILDGRP